MAGYDSKTPVQNSRDDINGMSGQLNKQAIAEAVEVADENMPEADSGNEPTKPAAYAQEALLESLQSTLMHKLPTEILSMIADEVVGQSWQDTVVSAKESHDSCRDYTGTSCRYTIVQARRGRDRHLKELAQASQPMHSLMAVSRFWRDEVTARSQVQVQLPDIGQVSDMYAAVWRVNAEEWAWWDANLDFHYLAWKHNPARQGRSSSV